MIVKSYVNDICDRVKGKRVLDVGCCATTAQNLLKRHNVFKEAATQIIGVDINRKLLALAQQRGAKNLYHYDMTMPSSGVDIVNKFGKFEKIICTDVVEHVGNITSFLNNLYFILADGGQLLITTPNMRSSRWYAMFVRNKVKINPDHVCWYDIFTLENILKRSKLKVVETLYHSPENHDAGFLKLVPQEWMARRLYVIVEKE